MHFISFDDSDSLSTSSLFTRALYAVLTIISLLNVRNKSSKSPHGRFCPHPRVQTVKGAGDTPIDEDTRQRNLSALNIVIHRGDISSSGPERSRAHVIT